MTSYPTRSLSERVGRTLRPSCTIALLGFLVIVIVLGASVMHLAEKRSATLLDARREADNLVLAVSVETSRSFEGIDLVVRQQLEAIHAAGVSTEAQFEVYASSFATHEALKVAASSLPQIDIVSLVDADGKVINFNRFWPIPEISLADRDYYVALKNGGPPGPFISTPVRNRGDGNWTVYIARRVESPTGDLLGLVLGGVRSQYFADMYKGLSLGSDSAVVLMRQDGILLMRQPEIDGQTGRSLAGGLVSKALAQGNTQVGFAEDRSLVDGVLRIASARALTNLPLVVAITRDKRALLQGWWQEAEIIVGGAGTLVVCVAAVIAMSFRREHESERNARALADSEASKRAIFESAMHAIFTLDEEGRFIEFNAAAERIFGYRHDEVFNRVMVDVLIPHEQRTHFVESMEAWIAHRDPAVFDRLLQGEAMRADGSTFPTEIGMSPIDSAGGVRFVVHLRDISLRKQAERQLREREEQAISARAMAEEAGRAKSDFLATMSHEIRTPLNAVLGLAGNLLDDPLTPTQREAVQAIRDSGDSLLRILNDILDFSKLDAGRMTFEARLFSPTTLTQNTVSILGPRARAKGLAIVAEVDPDMPVGLLGDPGRIRQVLLNLVSNAVKFTDSGNVTISARCLGTEESAATIEWMVRDTGIGIRADRLVYLFREFVQADSTINRRFGGSGLGLAISKRLVDQMGGSIGVASEPGVGTTFFVRLTLPIAQAPLEMQATPAETAHALETWSMALGRPLRILFAEDNPTNQFVVRQLLKGVAAQVDIVGDGVEAVAATSRIVYDVIFMDMRMPEMDGLAATRLIRQHGVASARVPIIALTANAFPEDVTACFDAGMDQFVTKPVTKDLLIAAILQSLSTSSPPTPFAPHVALAAGS